MEALVFVKVSVNNGGGGRIPICANTFTRTIPLQRIKESGNELNE